MLLRFEKYYKKHDELMYNADGTGLYWTAIPKKTLAAGRESSAAGSSYLSSFLQQL